MSCKVEYINGKIDKVLNSENKKSKLFEQISKLPFVDSLEEALEAYKNIYVSQKEELTNRDSRWGDDVKESLPSSNFEDEKQFEDFISTGVWGILTAENPNNTQISDRENMIRNQRAIQWLEIRGYNPQKIFGKYENLENSFIVSGLKSQDAVDFSKAFEQESVATNDGLIFQDGKISPILKEEISFEKKLDSYSTIKIHGKLKDFSIGYDFNKKIDVEGLNNSNVSVENFMEEEPLNFISDRGNNFNSYKEALLDSNTGDISVELEGRQIYSISSNTNKNTKQGFINSYIKSGLMSDQKLIENGESFLQSEGSTDEERVVNDFIIDEDAKVDLGTANRTVTKDGRIILRDVKGKVELDTKSGKEVFEISDFDSMSNEEIQQNFSDSDFILVSKAVKSSILERTFGTPTEDNQLTEKELKTRLMSLMGKMGVSFTSIEEYSKNYKLKNGIEPSANALADISNQIIAFKNGDIDISSLTEESAHFIVEAWNEGDISNLLRNIDKTEEYKEFQNQYRDIYSKQGTDEEVENLVRKEVLGKILAKSLLDNFSVENKTDIQSNIIDYIKNLFSGFIEKISNLFKNQDEIDLNNFTNQVNNLLLNQNIDNYLNLKLLNNKKFVMYQATPSSGSQTVDNLLRQSKTLLQVLQQQEKDLLKADKGLKSNVKKLKELEQRLDTAVVKDSVVQFLSTAKRQAQYINKAADIANRNGNFLTNEEGIVSYSLKNTMAPILSEIKDYLVKENLTENKVLTDEIDKVIIEVADIEGKIRNQDNKIFEGIVDRMMIRHNLSPEVKNKLMDATKAAVHDTTAFYATFGQLSHARDPLLNIAGTIIHDITFDSNVNFLRKTKGFQEKMRELGFTEKDLKQFFDKGYFVDIRDWSAFETKESEISANILKDVSGTELTVQQIQDLKRDPKSHKNQQTKEYLKLPQLTAEQNQQYNRRYRSEMSPYLETVFDEQYYKDEEEKYQKYKISEATIRERKDLSTDRGVLLSRVKDFTGKVRFTNQDKIDLNALNIKRKKLKSLYNEVGNIKTGITEPYEGTLDKKVDVNNPDIIELNGKIIQIDRSVASDEAIVAFDLNKLDLLYQQEQRENPTALSEEFLDDLKSIEENEGRDEALEFYRLNTFTNFSDEYWDNQDSSRSFIERLKNIEGSEDLVYQLDELGTKRKQILKQYQSQQDASDILVSEISKDVKDYIISLSDEIDRLFLEGSRLLNDIRSDEEITSITEVTPNESYYNETKNFNIQDKIQFILNNTTTANKRKILDFQFALDDLSNKGKSLTNSKQRVYDRFNKENDEQTLLSYAESKLAPYYVRFAPEGFSQYQDRLENSSDSVHDIVQEMNSDRLLQITNNFSYYKAEEQSYRNKNFKSDFEGGYFQPKLSAFRNAKFEEMFNPTIVDGEVESVGKNQNLYELYKETLDYHRTSLAVMGELGSHNLWKAPQISKTGMNKFMDFMKEKNKRGTLKESLKDALFYRVDDQAYGAEIDGESTIKTTGARYIPKYFLKDLENAKDVSEDLFYSVSAFAQQAYLYESRKNYFSDMMAVQEALLSRQYPEGKAAESSSTVEMFKSYMDAYLFGVKESKQLRVNLPVIGQVDLTKNIRFLHTWILNRNLGFNAVVPFTSWVTAEAQTAIEKYVKEYINPYSVTLARTEFAKLATDAIKDTWEVNSKAKLNVLMEHLGVYDIERRYENSIYSKTFRSIPKLGMFLNEAANFPIIPRVVLNVLYDYRVVGDNILTYNQYEKSQKDAGMSQKDIVANWKTLETKALYNYIKVDGTSVTYDTEKLKADTNTQLEDLEFEKFLNEKEKAVTTRIREVVKVVDGQIPSYERSAAQRHFFLSFFTTHRGWLAIAYARRFKNKHLNLQTGQEEQGSYRSFANFLGGTITSLYKNGFKDFLKDVKEDWQNADEIQRSNIKRVVVELSFLQGIVAIGFLLGAMAEDDKNKDLYALQLTNYLYFRLMNETTSSQVAIGQQFYEMIKDPIVGADTVKSIFSVSKYFDTEEIKTGRYAGEPKWKKQLMSVVPGYKSAIDIANPKDSYNSYKHFNPTVELYNPIWWILEQQGK